MFFSLAVCYTYSVVWSWIPMCLVSLLYEANTHGVLLDKPIDIDWTALIVPITRWEVIIFFSRWGYIALFLKFTWFLVHSQWAIWAPKHWAPKYLVYSPVTLYWFVCSGIFILWPIPLDLALEIYFALYCRIGLLVMGNKCLLHFVFFLLG